MDNLLKVAHQINSFKEKNGKKWKKTLIGESRSDLIKNDVLLELSKESESCLDLFDFTENISDIVLLLNKHQGLHNFRMNMSKGA